MWSALKDALQRAWQRGYIQIGKPVECLRANTKAGRAELIELGQQFRQCKFVTKSTLIKERGWTEGLLKKYGFTSDLRAENPHYRRGAPMLLYQLNRVARIERDDEVAADLARVLSRRPGRKQSALRASETRSAEKCRQAAAQLESFRAFMSSVEFIIPRWPVPDLVVRAIAHYNGYHWNKRCPKNALPLTLARMSINFLMYDCIEYETLLRMYPGEEYQPLIHHKITAAIERAYPDLAGQIVAAGTAYQ